VCDKRSRRKSFFFQKSGFFWPFTVVICVSPHSGSPCAHVIGALLRLLPSYWFFRLLLGARGSTIRRSIPQAKVCRRLLQDVVSGGRSSTSLSPSLRL